MSSTFTFTTLHIRFGLNAAFAQKEEQAACMVINISRILFVKNNLALIFSNAIESKKRNVSVKFHTINKLSAV